MKHTGTKLLAVILLSSFACASQPVKRSPPKAKPVYELKCGHGGWDDVHQKLFDAGVIYRNQYKLCQAERKKLERMLEVRTSTASRINILKPESKSTFWKDTAIFLVGVVAGGVTIELVR